MVKGIMAGEDNVGQERELFVGLELHCTCIGCLCPLQLVHVQAITYSETVFETFLSLSCLRRQRSMSVALFGML